MKKMLTIVLLGILMIACSKNTKETEVAVTSVTLSQPTAEMVIGETITLDATVLPSNASDKSVKWASSKISVATVSNSGQVTALAEGSTTITASAGGKSASCQVTVSKNYVEVTSVSINKTELALKKGQSETLVAAVKPDDASDKTVIWSSADTAVATVDGEGKVTAVAGGETTITAKAGNQQATCVVTVTVPVESISLDRESITLEEGGLVTLVATIKPDDASEKKSTWSSTDTQIVTVDNNGNVTALKEGSATVIAEAEGKKAECVVTVQKKYIAVTSISINKSELQLEKGQTETLIATVKPDDATDKTVVWSSSNSGVATVDNDGKVSAIGGGSAVITAKAGNLSATCAITVIVPVESITLDKTSVTLIEGESITLSAVVKPDNATDKTVVWSSTDSSIATVENGFVTAKKEGEAAIVAKHGTKEARCQIKVEHDVASDAITFSDDNIKQKLVAAFDTNGDGELSYGEAAAVTTASDILSALGSDRGFRSFDEFEFFTSVKTIPDSMFEGWTLLKSINLPESITALGKTVFKNCVQLTELIIPDNVSKIGSHTFEGCSQLQTISLSKGLKQISSDLFKGCSSLTSIEIPQGVEKIWEFAFYKCSSLTSVSIPGSVSYVGMYAFSDCTSIKDVYLDNLQILSVLSGNNCPFYSTRELTRLFISGVEATEIVIPESVVEIPSYAFKNCTSLTKVVIPQGVASIGDYAFYQCANLASLSLSEGLAKIGASAFNGCSISSLYLDNLSVISAYTNGSPLSTAEGDVHLYINNQEVVEINIPDGINEIPAGAFKCCAFLKSVSIPEGLKSIGGYAFEGCSSLTRIVIPESVSSIDSGAFSECTSLTSISLPKDLTTIGGSCFYGCTGLTSILLPKRITDLYGGCFQGCTGLTSVFLPEELITIGDSCFQDCNSLLSITIPSKVSSIYHDAFKDCSSLSQITVKAESAPIFIGGHTAFDNTGNCPIFVPGSSVDAYKNKWKVYADRIQAILE